ncbi:hypothetical protein N7456_000183 [Penicillium angulare]|uniref:Nephrocystin 3-like N-terminal domain-containing protein n=1 Tax=Penicillium angulare TaxID=116970 RepID=A0A9W9KRW7_9EURO|nr:hypothetical protein N7456_000183 [Penicillium angulare]
MASSQANFGANNSGIQIGNNSGSIALHTGGTWLLSKRVFLRWKNGRRSAGFWLHSLPGYGKTSIVSILIDEIAREINGDNSQTLSYFYCSDDISSNYPVSIALTFLRQILAQMPLGYNAIEEQYEKWLFQGLDKETLQFDEVWTLFCRFTQRYRRVYLIIDGLQEVELGERKQLLAAISRLNQDKARFKIFISSRLSPEASDRDEYVQWGIRPVDNEADIKKLVFSRTRSERRFGPEISPETKQYIRHILVQRAQGMFLWANLQLNELDHALTEAEMISIIDTFPTDLDSLYHKLFDLVNQQRGSKRILACAVLELLAFAQQPLTLDTVKWAVGPRTQSAGLYTYDIDLSLILHVCHSMVLYDEKLHTLRLVHKTARQYLTKTLNNQLVHAWLAEICLQELLRFASTFPSNLDYAHLGLLAGAGTDTPINFTLYAAINWHYHGRNCTQTQVYQKAESAFLYHKTAPHVWIQLLKTANGAQSSRFRTLLGFLRAYVSTNDCLFLAASFFGLHRIFDKILANGNITIGGRTNMPSFEHIKGCIAWIDQVWDKSELESRAREWAGMTEREAVNLVGKDGALSGYPLMLARILSDVRCAGAICAAEQGHGEMLGKIVNDLLIRESPSDPQLNQFKEVICSCQCLATAGGHFGVLETLDSMGIQFYAFYAKVHPHSPFAYVAGNKLGLSAFFGNRDMLLFWKKTAGLLDAQDIFADLLKAVQRNDVRAVELILDNLEVDINTRHSFSGPDHQPPEKPDVTVLMTAAIRGYHRVIKALLQHPNIDVNAKAYYGNTALMQAGSSLAVAALCKHGDLDIHIPNQLGETALDIFVKCGFESEIEELSNHPRFDPNRRNRWGETPMITAVRLREVSVVKVLLRVPFTDLDVRDNDGLTALEVATRLDHSPLMRLLSRSADDRDVDLVERMENLSVAMIPLSMSGKGEQLQARSIYL